MTKEELKQNDKYQQACLILLERNEKFKNEFSLYAPEIVSDIESAAVNKNCSCRGRVVDYINQKQDDFLTFLYDFLIKNDAFVEFIQYMDSIVIHKDYSGKIAKTSIAEWKNFSKHLMQDNATFKTFSLLKDGDDILVFFL